jgi:HlyD family secretion protein
LSDSASHIFRDAAIDRLSSPDQLDQLVGVTRPMDWLGAWGVGLALVVLLAWGVLGRVETRVGGDGVMVGAGGRVVEAAAGVGGRLGGVAVSVGDHVTQGQTIAQLLQADIASRQRSAQALLAQRQREYADLLAADAGETRAEDASDAAREAGFAQAEAAADDRAGVLARSVKTDEGLVKQGLATEPDLQQLRADLAAARQRAIEAHNAALALRAERLDRQSRRARDALAARYRVDDASRDIEQASEAQSREGRVISPIAGRVTEVKVSAGDYLPAGAPVAAIESTESTLQAVIFLPPDRGKEARPGQAVRIEPANVRRDEYGALIGRVVSVSAYPATPEGMAATLHNAELVNRFSRGGPPYAVVVRLLPDARAPSGYRWSSGRGPDLRISSGTLAHAEVVTREQPPIALLLPLLRRLSGTEG